MFGVKIILKNNFSRSIGMPTSRLSVFRQNSDEFRWFSDNFPTSRSPENNEGSFYHHQHVFQTITFYHNITLGKYFYVKNFSSGRINSHKFIHGSNWLHKNHPNIIGIRAESMLSDRFSDIADDSDTRFLNA